MANLTYDQINERIVYYLECDECGGELVADSKLGLLTDAYDEGWRLVHDETVGDLTHCGQCIENLREEV